MNYYEILEVSPNASQEVIRAAYKSLMQRYHPDRNPEDVAIAKRALLVGQAYAVLSDPTKRAAYDNELNRQTTKSQNDVEVSGQFAQQPAANSNLHSGRFVFTEAAFWVGAVIALIAAISSSIDSDKANKLASEHEAEFERKQNSDIMLAAKIKKDDEAGTIQNFAENLTVQLKPTQSDSDNHRHYLTIPKLGVIVGNVEQKRIMQYLADNKNFIKQNLIKELAASDYRELMKLDGEQYLSRTIAESMNNTIGIGFTITMYVGDFEGVKEILLPSSFSVHWWFKLQN